MSDLEDEYACGLDLGTTFSCIGVYKNGGVEIIPNKNGDRTTPSIVTILDKETIVRGEETYEYLVKNYDSSIYAIKRFIGRDFQDESIKEEIQLENLPFKIIPDEKNKYPVVEINKDDEKIRFTLEEITSFRIGKMVESAENYLNKTISSLVITVPANFNDAQRNCTKQAAKLAGVEVLRIINEPTAAALAYGLQDKGKEINGKTLVFDLGGGTFDVTILNINKDKKNSEQIFEILSTNGDKFLGGEDFDNKIVEYALDKFCYKNDLNKEEIKKDKKALRKLKIACEKIKRVLSSSRETTLCINHFYDNKDILEKISSIQFNELTKDLIKKLEKPLKEALTDAKITADEISEIVLVGGSTRLPMVKLFLARYFKKAKINDTINPDETVAYGATLMAARILIKKDNLLSGFKLMDITPLSLGVEILNDSKEKEIQKEGGKMSVIVKRGVRIPYTNSRVYTTTYDNQTTASITIYEGEKKYVKYNHILGKLDLSGLPERPKGKVKINVKFFIDINGILTVTGTEGDGKENKNFIEAKIKNDMVNLTEEQIEKLREKNEQFLNPALNSLDYSNLKESLKECQDTYNECTEDSQKFNILMNYNNILEEFIDSFDKDFDNETMIEKYYIYLKELFISYTKTLKMEEEFKKNPENKEILNNIINKVKEYCNQFIAKSSGYLNDLVETIKDFPEKNFYEIIVYIMEKFNECGKNCLREMQKFCRYNSLIYFEKALKFYKTYIKDLKNVNKVCHKKIYDNCKLQYEECKIYLEDINSDAILLCQDSIRLGKIISKGCGFTKKVKGLNYGLKEEKEKNELVLENYEKMYAELQGKKTKEEAICLANIIKINFSLLGYNNFKDYLKLADNCQLICKQIKIDPNTQWYKEFKELHKELKDKFIIFNQNEIREQIKTKYKDKFDEIEEKFNKKTNGLDFINFVLEKYPYPKYETDKKNNVIDFSNESQELFKYLSNNYHPGDYILSKLKEEEQLKFCITEEIESRINVLFQHIQ